MDQNKYVNAYIESTVGMLHENISQLLQLKAQLKMTNDVVSEKDNIISELTNKLNTNQTFEQEYHRIVQRNQELENENMGLKSKVSHLDTFVNQINMMKNTIIENEKTILKQSEYIAKIEEQIEGTKLKDQIVIEDIKETKKMKQIKSKKEAIILANNNTSNTDDF